MPPNCETFCFLGRIKDDPDSEESQRSLVLMSWMDNKFSDSESCPAQEYNKGQVTHWMPFEYPKGDPDNYDTLWHSEVNNGQTVSGEYIVNLPGNDLKKTMDLNKLRKIK